MNNLEREILIWAHRDVIQLAQVISVAHFEVGIPFGDEMFDAVAAFATSAIGNELMIVGDLDLNDSTPLVKAWSGDVDSQVNRIIADWRALGRLPKLSEVCWFDLTERGEIIAGELYRAAVKTEGAP